MKISLNSARSFPAALPAEESQGDAASSLECSILVVAGEASGDEHTAPIVELIRKHHPQVQVFGMGGSSLRKAGMDTIVDSESSASVMGFGELFGKLGGIISAFRLLRREAELRDAKLAILVDMPDFNLRMAKALKRKGIPVLYFVAPQLWAWRSWRVRVVRKVVDRLAVIIPFEEAYFKKRGVRAEYVGHPFFSHFSDSEKSVFCATHGLNPELPMLALLPGSRKGEVERLFPVMLETLKLIRQARGGVQAIVPVAATIDSKWLAELHPLAHEVHFISGNAADVMRHSDCSIVASGTATVEALLSGTPFVVVYRLATVSYVIGRLFVRGVKYFAMANLITGRPLVPELLQEEVTPERLRLEVEKVLGDEQYAKKQRHILAEAKRTLIAKEDSRKTHAERVFEMAEQMLARIEKKGPSA